METNKFEKDVWTMAGVVIAVFTAAFIVSVYGAAIYLTLADVL